MIQFIYDAWEHWRNVHPDNFLQDAKREKQWQVKFEELQAQILSGEKTTVRNSRCAVQRKCVSHNPPHENRPKWPRLGRGVQVGVTRRRFNKKIHPHRASGDSTMSVLTNAVCENAVCDKAQDCMLEECQEAGRVPSDALPDPAQCEPGGKGGEL